MITKPWKWGKTRQERAQNTKVAIKIRKKEYDKTDDEIN